MDAQTKQTKSVRLSALIRCERGRTQPTTVAATTRSPLRTEKLEDITTGNKKCRHAEKTCIHAAQLSKDHHLAL